MIRRLLALFALPQPAWALGTDVYWYEGNGGQNATVNPMVSQAMLTAGASAFTESVLWPSSFSSYRVVFLSITRTAYTSAQIADLSLFLDGGGVVVLIGDATPYDSTHAVTYNSLLATLGRSSRFSTSASYDSGCVQSAIATGSHPLSGGAATLGMAWGGAVVPAGTGSTVYRGASGQAFVAYDQGLVLVPDGEVFNTACSALPAENGIFATNIYNMACDWDADGEQAAFCGGLDCDDQDPLLGTGDPFFRDYDGDGFGDAGQSQNACTAPAGYVADATDCDDLSSTTAPGRAERCDGADNDCDGSVDEGLPTTRWYLDADTDGYGGATTSTTDCNTSPPSGYSASSNDCDDADASLNPAATELCDGVDQDCDGQVDDAAVDGTLYYPDQDGDGYGSRGGSGLYCSLPASYAAVTGDCDDRSATVYPGATERCNSTDDDCDGLTDESAADASLWYRDRDGDGVGGSLSSLSCTAPSGYVQASGDCNDGDTTILPGAAEYCNLIDDDCNGSTDDAPVDGSYWFADSDADGYGDLSTAATACNRPTGRVADATDCDDSNAQISPSALEICNSLDDDCDGSVDPPGMLGATLWYLDGDGDGAGDPAQTRQTCTQPAGYVVLGGDCDDAEPMISPSALEQCDGLDNNCDGLVDAGAAGASLWFADVDGDGYGDAAGLSTACDQPVGYVDVDGDCDDAQPDIFPGASEVPYDGLDQDCDGTDQLDVDGDGWSWPTDCYDTEAAVFPGAYESADGVDEDCDGGVDEGTVAADDDGDGVTEDAGDCDDTDSTIVPGAAELPDLLDQDCDGVTDEGTVLFDDDGDGFSEQQGDCNDGVPETYPSAAENFGNGIDDDCDGVVDSGELDTDGDGYTTGGGDCDPSDPLSYPEAEEVPDGVDNNCDGRVDEGTPGVDDDGDGYAGDDCDDADPARNPGAEELPDGVDQDCDGVVDEGTRAADDDGDGLTEDAGDCNDDDATIRPGARELPNQRDDDCDGQVDEGAEDADADGFAVVEGDCDDRSGWVHPGMAELCDGLDNDCNGSVDDRCGEEDSGKTGPAPQQCGCGTSAPTGLGLIGLLALGRRRKPARSSAVS